MAAEEGAGAAQSPRLSDERVSLQTHFGTVELAFFPDVAPQHYRHVLKVFQMGLYNTNHFFRVDKGFVSQIADVVGGRHPDIPMSFEQRLLAKKNIPAEFSNIPHKAGILSMARYSDPDSATTSFSILLGDAPHLDGQYTVFGKVTKGLEVVESFQSVETTKQGIFVMPKERITIASTYIAPAEGQDAPTCDAKLKELTARFQHQAAELNAVRQKCLPG